MDATRDASDERAETGAGGGRAERGGRDASDASDDDGVVRALADFIAAPRFQRHFEQFFLDHALAFTDDPEHRLDYMQIYLRFQEMFNAHMETFLASVELSETEFLQRCQKAIKNDPKAEQYLEIVVASMDYDAFYHLMKAMRSRASLQRLQADAKAQGDDDDDDDPKASASVSTARGHVSKRGRDDDDDAASESKKETGGAGRDELAALKEGK